MKRSNAHQLGPTPRQSERGAQGFVWNLFTSMLTAIHRRRADWRSSAVALLFYALSSTFVSLAGPVRDSYAQDANLWHQLSDEDFDRLFKKPNPSDGQPQWFPPGSNFELVFSDNKASDRILEWINPNQRNVKTLDWPSFTYNGDSMQFRQRYAMRPDLTPVINFAILIPHPRSRSSREIGINTQFNEIDHRLEGGDERPITVGKVAGVFRYKNSQCALKFTTPFSGVMEFYAPECKDQKRFLTLINSFEIERFLKKLSE